MPLRSRLYLLLLIPPLAAGACSTTGGGLPYSSIRVASGGGVTGTWQGFVLGSDGSLLRWERSAAGAERLEPIRRLPLDSVRLFQRRLEEIGIWTLDLHAPYNISRSIMVEREGAEKEVVWGDPSVEPPAELTVVYRDLLTAFGGGEQ